MIETFELGYLLYQAKKRNRTFSLKGIVLYREPMPSRLPATQALALWRVGALDQRPALLAVSFFHTLAERDMEAVRTFAGEDHEAAVVPPKARALLSRFDERSQHYQVEAKVKV